MCGGVGSRFWPLSREHRPKQFIDFMGTGRSLLQMTYDRMTALVAPERVLVVTNAAYVDLIAEQLPALDRSQILAEPARRNTAPCILWAAHHIAALSEDASMIVTPADHLILNPGEFVRAAGVGFDFVERHDALLTLGIEPSRPETGYGYIQLGKPVADDICRVKTFTEKPNEELARVFLASGDFKWNSGVFIWGVKTVLSSLEQHCPELAARFDAGRGAYGTPAEMEFIKREFPACPSISIDYALMEKAKNVYVESVDPAWNDLGTWSALYDNSPRNNQGNVTQGVSVFSYDTSGCVFSESNSQKVIVVDGLKDYVIADTDDVLLICPMAHEQQIKQYVNDVTAHFPTKH